MARRNYWGSPEGTFTTSCFLVLAACYLFSKVHGATSRSTINKYEQLNEGIANDLGFKSVEVVSLDAHQLENEEPYVVLTGTGVKKSGEKVEYVACKYSTDEGTFKDLLESIKDIEDLDITVEEAEDLLDVLVDVVEKGQLLNHKEKADITYSKEGVSQILGVSQVRVDGNRVYYYVASLDEGTNEKGETGLITTIDKISFELTEELRNDPSLVYSMGDKGAKIETVGQKFRELDTQNYRVIVNNKK